MADEYETIFDNPGGAIDPVSQFETKELLQTPMGDTLVTVFTNANLMMVLGLLATYALIHFGLGKSAGRVPTRMQVVAEGTYTFVKTTLLGATGDSGKPFLRLMVTLFLFIFMGNVLGMINNGPGNIFHTYTAHVYVTVALGFGLMIFITGLGIYKHGLKFFTLFAPSGISPVLLIIIVPIEVISYLTRPITLAVRLFANMMAGHAVLKTMAGFPGLIAGLTGSAVIGGVSLLVMVPLLIAITGLEFVIAFLQAYVFVMLGSMYFKDAIHLH